MPERCNVLAETKQRKRARVGGRRIATAFAEADAPVVGVSRTAAAFPEPPGGAGIIRPEATDATVPARLLDLYQPQAAILVAGAIGAQHGAHHGGGVRAHNVRGCIPGHTRPVVVEPGEWASAALIPDRHWAATVLTCR
jgi:hypothetical protein